MCSRTAHTRAFAGWCGHFSCHPCAWLQMPTRFRIDHKDSRTDVFPNRPIDDDEHVTTFNRANAYCACKENTRIHECHRKRDGESGCKTIRMDAWRVVYGMPPHIPNDNAMQRQVNTGKHVLNIHMIAWSPVHCFECPPNITHTTKTPVQTYEETTQMMMIKLPRHSTAQMHTAHFN